MLCLCHYWVVVRFPTNLPAGRQGHKEPVYRQACAEFTHSFLVNLAVYWEMYFKLYYARYWVMGEIGKISLPTPSVKVSICRRCCPSGEGIKSLYIRSALMSDVAMMINIQIIGVCIPSREGRKTSLRG